jgi:hypothetical protein
MPDRALTPDEQTCVVALLHDANAILRSDGPDSPTRENELDGVKKLVRLAETIAAGKADDAKIRSVPGLLHPETASLFGFR